MFRPDGALQNISDGGSAVARTVCSSATAVLQFRTFCGLARHETEVELHCVATGERPRKSRQELLGRLGS
jgi:hypothetical protein